MLSTCSRGDEFECSLIIFFPAVQWSVVYLDEDKTTFHDLGTSSSNTYEFNIYRDV